MVMDVAGRYYFQPESGGLLISPADATLSAPCDAQAEEIDVALGARPCPGGDHAAGSQRSPGMGGSAHVQP